VTIEIGADVLCRLTADRPDRGMHLTVTRQTAQEAPHACWDRAGLPGALRSELRASVRASALVRTSTRSLRRSTENLLAVPASIAVVKSPAFRGVIAGGRTIRWDNFAPRKNGVGDHEALLSSGRVHFYPASADITERSDCTPGTLPGSFVGAIVL
jgi:hypothetical protein